MFCTDISSPIFFLFTDSIPSLIYYSHIPTAIVSLLIGFFVFFKSEKSLEGKLLLGLSLIFSLWTLLNLIVWANVDSRIIMFAWSLLGMLYVMIYALSFYFTYVYASKKDLSINKKILLAVFVLPIIFFMATKYNLPSFDISNCEATENRYYLAYYYYFGLVLFLVSMILVYYRYFKISKEYVLLRNQLKLFGLGIGFFLLSFFVSGYLSSMIDNFELEQYGLFGMTVFMGFLAYLIVKFRAFDIRLIGAQALVFVLILLIASQFTFVQNSTSIVLTGITLVLSIGFGYILIKSIKTEVRRKEELQHMADALAISNDRLRQLDNAKTEFVSIASHQLRTPLTAIKGFVSLLLEGSYGKVSEEAHEALNKVHMSTERLINLVEDLLNVSRIESGRMEYKFENQDIKVLLADMEAAFAIVAKEKDLSFEIKLPEDKLPDVAMDSAKMREVVSNLIDNALKYTERGGVTVRAEFGQTSNFNPLKCRQLAEEKPRINNQDQDPNIGANGYIRVTVSDTGIGIPETELPYLFAKFSRGKDTSRLHVGGTGLGLFVGKGIVEAHKGHIWAESDGDGRGSRFIIELPVA